MSARRLKRLNVTCVDTSTELTLNAGYNANEPHFEAAEANGSDSVTLKADNGKFTIVVKDPTASSVNGTFTLVVGNSSEDPENPPVDPEIPEANLQLELTATDTIDVYGTSYTANAKLDLYDDNTFKMLVDAGQGYVDAASGTWELDQAYNMVLTVKEQTIVNSLPETITLNVDYTTYGYNGKVTYVASAYTTFNFMFAPKTNEPEKPALENDIILNASDSIYDDAITCDSVLNVKTDGTWTMRVTVYGNTIDNAASGTWVKKEDGTFVLTVTQKADGAGLADTITLTYDPTTDKYSTSVALNCMGQFDFTLNFA